MLTQLLPPAATAPSVEAEAIELMSYRSRANGRPDWQALDALTRAAQQRNRAARLTGVLLYEDGRFFQTIEGPPALLAPVWAAIQADPRHRDVEVLARQTGTTRFYTGWDMRWLRRGADGYEDAGTGLGFLEPAAPSDRFATLALDDGDAAIGDALDHAHGGAELPELLDYAIEPAARALGDAWTRDDIDALALDVALSRFNRIVHDRAARATPPRQVGKVMLAATFPRETHLLGAVAAAELHAGAGWWVDLAFPGSDAELADLVANTAYDRLDIAASDALDRGDRDRAATLAPMLKRASRNPAIEISFGGRAFWAEGPASDHDWCRFRSSAAAFRFPDGVESA